jgi:hypothetical protein
MEKDINLKEKENDFIKKKKKEKEKERITETLACLVPVFV